MNFLNESMNKFTISPSADAPTARQKQNGLLEGSAVQ